MTTAATAGCCDSPLRHCHGTWVRHADGTGECTDDTFCLLPPAAHEDVASCAAVDVTCCPP